MTYQNFVRTQVADPITVGAVSIIISEAVFPYVLPPEDGILTITDSMEAPTKFEIISYVGRIANGNNTYTLNAITKGREGTTDQAWSPGSIIIQTLTAAQAADFAQLSVLASDEGTIVINGGSF